MQYQDQAVLAVGSGVSDHIDPEDRAYIESLPGYDRSYEIIHIATFHGYDDWGWMVLCRKDGQLYQDMGGSSPMALPDAVDSFCPSPIGEDQGVALMIGWEADV